MHPETDFKKGFEGQTIKINVIEEIRIVQLRYVLSLVSPP